MNHQTLEMPVISAEAINRIFKLQNANAKHIAETTPQERIKKLEKIQSWLITYQTDIQNAIHQDFRKFSTEADATELLPLHGELRHIIKNLKAWMKPTRVSPPRALIGTNSYIQYEAKGVCLIIAPWNYPFLLAVNPLLSAIAAGNTAMIKPSELTPNTSNIIHKMVEELFDESEVAVVEGGVDVSQALLELPFDHIFFTGSPNVGKIVMAAGAKHLTSVTLELGGKSPTIVDKTANLYTTGEKIAWGKLLNNGQTCIAPDYVLAEASIKNKLIENLITSFNKMLNPKGAGIKNSPDYARIVNQKHFNRLKYLLEDAIHKGAKIEFGGELDESENYFSPTILSNVTNEMKVMQDEIFGPILPIMTYEDKTDVLKIIQSKPKPLALYIFTTSAANKDYFLQKTTAGGTVVNDCLIHYAQTNLPFGGVNNSGIGKAGGHFGFLDFSNHRAVIEQKFAPTNLLYPPYTNKVKKVIDLLMKWG